MNELKSPLEQIRQNWVILLFIGSLIATWTMFSSRLTQAEGKINELSEVVSQINTLNIDIAVIRNDVGYIKANLEN